MEQELLYDGEKKPKFHEQLKKRISSEFVPMCREVGNEELVSDAVMRALEGMTDNFPPPPSHIPQHRFPTNEQAPTTSTYSTAMKATSSYFGNLRQAMTDRVSGISMGKR